MGVEISFSSSWWYLTANYQHHYPAQHFTRWVYPTRKRSSCERDAQVWQRRMGFISRWASRPAPVNPAWFTGLQCGNPWFIAAEWRAREWCASNPGPWAVSTLLQLFGYYHGYFGTAVNLVWCMRISVLTAANSSAVDDEWVSASWTVHCFQVPMFTINRHLMPATEPGDKFRGCVLISEWIGLCAGTLFL